LPPARKPKLILPESRELGRMRTMGSGGDEMRTEKKIKERVVGGGPTRRCGHRPSPEKAGIATALYLIK
jgi:hypothetical protein